MIVTRLAVVIGLLFLGLLCYLSVAGSAAATGLLVTAVTLVVLVGGGNWLSDRRSRGAPSHGGDQAQDTTSAEQPGVTER